MTATRTAPAPAAATGEELRRLLGLLRGSDSVELKLTVPESHRDELRSVFSPDTFNDRTFVVASLLSVGAIVFATELGFFQRILDTVELTGAQWVICIAGGATVVAASEIRKWLLRRRAAAEQRAAAPA